jgi:hypothetical protein
MQEHPKACAWPAKTEIMFQNTVERTMKNLIKM